MTLSRDRCHALLSACPLFAGVGPDDLAAIASRTVEVDFAADQVIARQGEIGTGLFVIIDGSVRVMADGSELARLAGGEFFGELSVIDGLPRVAQVIAVDATRCLGLASWEFEQLVIYHPTIGLAVLRGLSARLRAKSEQAQH